MNLFTPKPSPVAEITGTDILRSMAAARINRIDYATVAKDLGIVAEHFREFAAGTRDLPSPALAALAKHFLDAEFDPALNRLRSKNRTPAASIGVTPLLLDC